MNKKRARRRQQWFAIGVAVLIIGSVVLALIAPGGNLSTGDDSDTASNDTNDLQQSAIQPAMRGIGGADPYIHPSGLYQVFQPNPDTNWGLDTQSANITGTRATTIYRGNCSVIYTYVDYGISFDTLEAVSENVLTDIYNAAEWALYEYDETSRTIDDTFIIANYDLVRKETVDTQDDGCPEDYKGRQVSWLDNGLLYAVRLVVRESDRAALDGLQDLIIPTFVTYPNNVDIVTNSTLRSPIWRTHPDPNSPIEQTWTSEGSFIVLPPDWRTDSFEVAFQAYDGFGIMDGYRLTVRSYPDTSLETLDDAEEWLGSLRLGIEFSDNNEPAENQRFGTGYLVSYTFQNADGDEFSAVASVLNDENGNLHVAELVTNQDDIDFLDEPENDAIATAQAIIRSFTITAPDDFVYTP